MRQAWGAHVDWREGRRSVGRHIWAAAGAVGEARTGLLRAQAAGRGWMDAVRGGEPEPSWRAQPNCRSQERMGEDGGG